MLFSDFHFFSDVLNIHTAAYILLPEPKVVAQSASPVPVLYLLHGLSDDHTMWLRQTRVELFARRYRLAVVMPAANRSFYMDMAHGAKYETFIARELPSVMERYFPVCRKRSGRFIAGLSMGGYGALRLALRYPGRYAAAASLSGCVEMEKGYETFASRGPFMLRELDDVYGSEHDLLRGPGSLFGLADRFLKEPDRAPRMYMACGTEDHLFEANEHFFARFGKELPIEYHTEPGDHNWAFWDRYLERVLAWLPLEKAEGVW